VKGSGVGKVNLQQDGEVAISRQLMAIRSEQVDQMYLFWLLASQYDHFQSLATGAAIPGLSRTDIGSLTFPLPPLAEQQRIVAILDEAFAAIATATANTEKNLANARELFESELNRVFTQKGPGWVEKTLGEVCEITSGQHIMADDYNTEGRGIGYLTGPSDFGMMYPQVTKWTERPKAVARPGDVLITVKGSGVGKVNLLLECEVAISRQLMAVRSSQVDRLLLFWYLSSHSDHFQSLATGAAIPGLSRGDLGRLRFSLPPLPEQTRIMARLEYLSDRSRALGKTYHQKLARLGELKQSLLHRAFTGQLTAGPRQLEFDLT
jgi:type I restriction enzyme S subunit